MMKTSKMLGNTNIFIAWPTRLQARHAVAHSGQQRFLFKMIQGIPRCSSLLKLQISGVIHH